LKFLPKSFGVYGGCAVVLVEPVGPVDVDAIWLHMEGIRYIDSITGDKKESRSNILSLYASFSL
jgi:hypothetical protein